MKVVYDDELNRVLAKVLTEGNEFITIISPYIKLSGRTKDHLKKIANENLNIKLNVVFGKNEIAPNKSLQKSDLDFFIDNFKDVTIYYKERLHAKCYVNEKMGLITSMNLYDYSLGNNLELGVFFENSVFNEFSRVLDYLTSQQDSTIEGQINNFMKHVKDASEIIYEKTANFTKTSSGLRGKYISSKITKDITDRFFKQNSAYNSDNIKDLSNSLNSKKINPQTKVTIKSKQEKKTEEIPKAKIIKKSKPAKNTKRIKNSK